jgi:hypothetical protein
MRRQWEPERGNFALRRPHRAGVDGGGERRRFAVDRYCGEPTQTAMSGVFEALGSGPQDAARSPRNCAALRVAPQ